MRRWALIPVVAVAAALAWWLWRPSSPSVEPPPPVLSQAANVEGAPQAAPAALDAGARVAVELHREVRVVEEETGAAIPNARVVLLAAPQVIADAPFLVREWQADERGSVAVQLTGEGALQATAEGHVWSPSVTGDELAAPLITLRCRRGVAVRGVVVDAKGAPLAGIRVTAENESLRTVRGLAARHTFDRARTGAGGQFQLWVLDGEVKVRAGSGLWRVTEERFETPSPPLRLVLQPGFAVRGQVFGADGGEAAFAQIECGEVRPEEADEHGRFEVGALEAAELTLDATSADGEERSGEVKAALRAGEWVDVELHLKRTLRVEGVVKNAAGQPVPGAFLAGEAVRGDDDALAMTVADWTGGSELRSGPHGEFSIDSHGVDPDVTLEVLAWTKGAQGSVRAHPGQRVELVLRETPMVTGAVTEPDGRPLTRFALSGAQVDSADGTFAVARSELDEQLAIAAAAHATAFLPLPDGGVDLGRVSLAQTHRVALVLTIDGHPPRNVAVDDEQLSAGPDGGLEVEVRLPSQVVWLHGLGFLSRKLEIGANDQVLRLELSPGGRLLLRTSPELELAAWFDFEDCVPPRAPYDGQRFAWPGDGGLLLAGLSAGRCRLVLHDSRWEGSAMVELPGEGQQAVANMTLTAREARPGTGFPMIRGPPPGRPHRPR